MADPGECSGQQNWEEFIVNGMASSMTCSSITERLEFLRHEVLDRLRRHDLPVKILPELLRLIFLTCTRYHDRASRFVVLDILKELNKWNATEFQKAFIPVLVKESEKRGKWVAAGYCVTSASDRFVLLTWINESIACVLQTDPSSPLLGSLVNAQGLLLGSFGVEDKASITQSALKNVRRVIRNHAEHIPLLFDLALANSQICTPSFRNAVLLGNILSTSLRLKKSSLKGESMVDDAAPKLKAYYLKNIVSSKTVVPLHVRSSLSYFIRHCITWEAFDSEYLPVFEKAILRSPEVALQVLTTTLSFIKGNLTTKTASALVGPLLNHMRASSSSVRENALESYTELISCDHDSSSCEKLATATIQGMTFDKVPSADHRVLYYKALHLLSYKDITVACRVVVEGLLTMIPKETQEHSARAAIHTLSQYMAEMMNKDAFAANHKTLIDKAVKVSLDGLKSSKWKKFWAYLVSHLAFVDPVGTETLKKHIGGYLQVMFHDYSQMSDKPLLWKDGPLEAYYLVFTVSGRIAAWPDIPAQIQDILTKENYPSNVLQCTQKPSYLLWSRVYTKALSKTEGHELKVAIQTLFTSVDVATLESTGAGRPCMEALIWAATCHPVADVRREARDSLANLSVNHSKYFRFAKPVVEQWLLDLEFDVKDSIPVIAKQTDGFKPDKFAYLLASVVLLLGPGDHGSGGSKEEKEKALLDLLLISHHPYLFKSKSSSYWIQLITCAGIDPRALVEQHASDIMDRLCKALHNKGKISVEFNKAACAAVATVVYIQPTMVKDMIALVTENLDTKEVSLIGEKERHIWNTPEGTLYVDVLSKKREAAASRRGPKSKDDAWEDQVRAELQKKNLGAVKLTRDEQAAVDAQLAIEAAVRSQVQTTYDKLSLGLDLIRVLFGQPCPELMDHMNQVTTALIQAAKAGACYLVGDALLDTLVCVGSSVCQDVELIREALAVSLLRTNHVAPLPERWSQETLHRTVDRLLYKLRYVTEGRSLAPESFAFCFPLIDQVIQQGGIDCKPQSDQAGEQMTLALGLMESHCSGGASPILPRSQMISDLLLCIQSHPSLRKEARACLEVLCVAMAETATRQEIDTLLQGLLSNEVQVRQASLHGLKPLDLVDFDYVPQLWLACYDDQKENAALAKSIWEENALDVDEDYKLPLLDYALSMSTYLQGTASRALASAVALYPTTATDMLSTLYARYKDNITSLGPAYDEYGILMPESRDRKDPWEERVGLGTTLAAITPHIAISDVPSLFSFLLETQALGDPNELVRKQMLHAGLEAVNTFGTEHTQQLLFICEEYLNAEAGDNITADYIRHSVVILYGTIARFLPPGDAKVHGAVDKLLKTLDTPSEVVQHAVAECLPPLVKMIKEDVPDLVERLMKKLFEDEKYAQRRGAAYGLAGVVKGRGITALKECNIMNTLKEATSNKQYQYKQGAMFAFETLSAMLGRLFEPYVVQIIPLLLTCAGDSNAEVREACDDTARMVMSKLSGHCVKLILPSILEGLDDRQWRTKKASVSLLGATAYCAPKQLSISLPIIIPRISEVLNDTHRQVQESARQSLELFGKVIHNPEIQAHVPVLLDALSDPNNKGMKALSALLNTSFVHYIDPPSLALVIPILERGLRERDTKVKTTAAQIVGNMASLTDRKDFVPYLPQLLPGMMDVLADPVPQARGTSAKALGSLVEALGEESFPDLVVELLDRLMADTQGVDRQGAAQGLAEILAGLGTERLDSLLPDIIANTDSPRAHVREGFMSLLIYLPATFGSRFQPYLGSIITPILSGLADDADFVRDVSMRAGRIIVTHYASKSLGLLLPQLEQGLTDANWRIRQSSVQLVGELLFRVTDTANPLRLQAMLGNVGGDDDTAGPEDEQQSEFTTDTKKKRLADVLGKERHDRIMAALYLTRQDQSGVVRHGSSQIWKAFVANTPRMLKDILPVIMSLVIKFLGSEHDDQRAMAAQTLNDLAQRLGGSTLRKMLTLLEENVASPEDDVRQGVVVALADLMELFEPEMVSELMPQISSIIKHALFDTCRDVRESAARAFDMLYEAVGSRAIDSVLPALLQQFKSTDMSSGHALSALKEIMAVRAHQVFPVLIPTLTQVPMGTFHAHALATLMTVAGPAMSRHVRTILRALMASRVATTDEETLAQLDDATKVLLDALQEDATGILMTTLFEGCRDSQAAMRRTACGLVATYYGQPNASNASSAEHVPEWIPLLIELLQDPDPTVVPAAWSALVAVTTSVPKETFGDDELLASTYHTVSRIGVAGCDVAGFCLPKGISPVLNIFLYGLVNGTPEGRTYAAKGIGCLVERTSSDALRPFVTQITGPLIRIAGDRYPDPIKAAILDSLCLMLGKVPQFLRPFLPQLQRTFTKSVVDTSSPEVQERAEAAMAKLKALLTK